MCFFPWDRAISRTSHISWMLSKWQTRVSYLKPSIFLSKAEPHRLLRSSRKALRILHFLGSQEKVRGLSPIGVTQLVAGSRACLWKWNPKKDMQKSYLPAQKPEGVQHDTLSHFWTVWKWVWESMYLYGMCPEEAEVFCVCGILLVITTPQSVCSVLLLCAFLLMKGPQQFVKEMFGSVKHWLF